MLHAAATQPTRHRMQTQAASVAVDARMGQHFATLDQALPGVTDEHVHIDAPVFGRQAFKDLAVAQGKLQRTEAGSKRAPRPQWSGRAAGGTDT